MQLQTQVVKTGLPAYSAGAPAVLSADQFGAGLASELNARYANLALSSTVFSISSAGAGQTQVAANLFSTAIATFQPIVGLYNPLTNTKNVIILKAWVGIVGQAASATVSGGFMYVVSSQQSITQAGTVPISNLTLKQSGSSVIGLVNQALTGATGSLLVLRPVASSNFNSANGATLTIVSSPILEDQVEGSIIVPPGGVIGIANGITGTTNTWQAGLTWAELPI